MIALLHCENANEVLAHVEVAGQSREEGAELFLSFQKKVQEGAEHREAAIWTTLTLVEAVALSRAVTTLCVCHQGWDGTVDDWSMCLQDGI